MSDQNKRAGQGPVVSPTEAKLNMGRSFVRAEHQGQSSNPTEWLASKRLGGDKPPTKTDIDLVFKENPADVRAMRAAKMSDIDIYNALRDRN